MFFIQHLNASSLLYEDESTFLSAKVSTSIKEQGIIDFERTTTKKVESTPEKEKDPKNLIVVTVSVWPSTYFPVSRRQCHVVFIPGFLVGSRAV